jgi:hypothetical protein
MAKHLKKEDFKRLMLSRYWLRGHFLVMLTCTALVTLGASHMLLALGLQNILVRYLICLLFSYLSFLVLLRIWLGLYIFPRADKASPDLHWDGLDVSAALVEWSEITPDLKGEGGSYSGAGASGGWDAPAVSKVEIPLPGDLDGDSAPVVLPLIAILVLVALVLFFVSALGIAFYAAPAVLCEVALEMAVTIGLVRLTIKEKDFTKGFWLWAALRATAIPFLSLLIVVLAGLGIILHYYPDVKKLSDIWQLISLL